MHSDHSPYLKFAGKYRVEKSINSLLGLVEGISVDACINDREVGFLKSWVSEHQELWNNHPYNELVPVVSHAIADGILSAEEKLDILWLCERLRRTDYFDKVTADLQRLHALVGGIAADGVVSADELRGLSEWMENHEDLRTCWPYDEIGSLVTKVLSDKRIDDEEQKLVQRFFSEFIGLMDNQTIVSPRLEGESLIAGLCAVCPEIAFSGSTFCFTGASSKYSRAEFSILVRQLGGEAISGVTAKLNYLIIGADGNPCWAYACYGRKVEKAVELRKKGIRLLLVHENDFHDAVADVR
ncbi:MAG: BRCT domain-containing protein [Pseudomonadota bacterium]